MTTKNTSFSLPKNHFLPQNKEEAELMDYIENTDFSFQSDTSDIQNIQQAFKNTISKQKTIHINLSEYELIKIKNQSHKMGIPYKTLIARTLRELAMKETV